MPERLVNEAHTRDSCLAALAQEYGIDCEMVLLGVTVWPSACEGTRELLEVSAQDGGPLLRREPFTLDSLVLSCVDRLLPEFRRLQRHPDFLKCRLKAVSLFAPP